MRAKGPAPIEQLTPREHEVAKLIMDGLSNKLIADKLGISEFTAKFHVFNTVTKIGSGSRVKTAVNYARWLDARSREASLATLASTLHALS